MLLCLCHHDTCHSRSCIRAGGAETGTGQKNSGHTGNVHKTAIRYGTDRGADVSGNEAGTGSGNVQPAEAGGIYTDLLSVWHSSYERGAGFRGERKIFIRERTGGGHLRGCPGSTGAGIRPGGNCGRKQPAAGRTHCISGGLYYCCKWKSGHEKRRTDRADQSVRGTTGGADPVARSRADSGIGGAG